MQSGAHGNMLTVHFFKNYFLIIINYFIIIKYIIIILLYLLKIILFAPKVDNVSCKIFFDSNSVEQMITIINDQRLFIQNNICLKLSIDIKNNKCNKLQ